MHIVNTIATDADIFSEQVEYPRLALGRIDDEHLHGTPLKYSLPGERRIAAKTCVHSRWLWLNPI